MVTNKGADHINQAALIIKGVTKEQLSTGYRGDPKVNSGPIYLKPGLQIRLTRNLDKDRGFVNGAVGTIQDVLSPCVFTVKLSSGVMVLVHPIHADGEHPFLPCTYGYATTIRRAQGSSLEQGALYFDHCYPAQRGYGYVGASRFKKSEGLYLYGKIRRTDWLPVDFGANKDDQEKRSALSESEESEIGDFEDYEPSDDEWDDWDMDVEQAYEEAGDADYEDWDERDMDVESDYDEPGDADFEDRGWKNLLNHKENEKTDLPKDNAHYDEPEDADFDDRPWKELLAKAKTTCEDLPEDGADSPLSDRDETATTDEEDLSTEEGEPPTMHKLGKAMMAERGTAMSDLPG